MSDVGKKFNRIMAILRLIQEENDVNRKSLANFCGVSERTISRYIEILRDSLGFQIYFDHQEKTYKLSYDIEGSDIESKALKPEEIILMIMALDSSESLGGPEIINLKYKLISHLPDIYKEKYLKMRKRLGLESLKSEKGRTDFINKIYRAILDKNRLDITYKPAYNNEEVMEVNVIPYGVTWKIDKCYLIGKDVDDDKVIIYRLDRIKDLSINYEKGEIPEDFDMEEYIASCWNMFFGELEEVVIKFDSSLRPLVNDKFEENYYEVISEDETSFTIKTEIRAVEKEFKRWLLKLEGKAEVLEPESLREELKSSAREILELYS